MARKPNIFLDSSALIAGVISTAGAAHALLQLGESGEITLTISEMVIVECERTIAKKSPNSLARFRLALKASNLRIVANPSIEQMTSQQGLIRDPQDLPILLSAMQAKVDFLATHNRRDFLDDSSVVLQSGLRIGSPGDALGWLRDILLKNHDS